MDNRKKDGKPIPNETLEKKGAVNGDKMIQKTKKN